MLCSGKGVKEDMVHSCPCKEAIRIPDFGPTDLCVLRESVMAKYMGLLSVDPLT